MDKLKLFVNGESHTRSLRKRFDLEDLYEDDAVVNSKQVGFECGYDTAMIDVMKRLRHLGLHKIENLLFETEEQDES